MNSYQLATWYEFIYHNIYHNKLSCYRHRKKGVQIKWWWVVVLKWPLRTGLRKSKMKVTLPITIGCFECYVLPADET